MMDLKNKIVAVTGSSSGIGEAVAKRFAEEGAFVIVNSKNNFKGGERVKNEILQSGGEAIHINAALDEDYGVKHFFKSIVQKYNRIDILINNAGRTIATPFPKINKENWTESMNDNLTTTVLCSVEAGEYMIKQGSGTIINTSSVRAFDYLGREGIMAYSAAKAGINSFTKTLAKELAPNIYVNAICPGFINTPYLERVSEELKKQWINKIPIKRFIEPSELAELYLFVAKSNYFTGSVITADGGFSLKLG